MVSMLAFVSGVKNRLSGEEKGATAVEYGIMVSLIAVAIIGTVLLLGGQLSAMFASVTAHLNLAP